MTKKLKQKTHLKRIKISLSIPNKTILMFRRIKVNNLFNHRYNRHNRYTVLLINNKSQLQQTNYKCNKIIRNKYYVI